ncbi:ASKHA domain-containing protein [Clostridium thailandense]|uniref:ASKHA domain-containing protein n=1 Tax=Clostridium thailandense TaxID=2794346 RepID=UPI003989D080
MNVFNGIDLIIEEKEIARLLGYKDCQPGEEIIEAIREEIKACRNYLNPVVYYEKINIKSIENSKVILENGISLSGEFISRKLKECKYIISAVTTLGREIDERIKEGFDGDDYLRGMIMDNIGIAALTYVDKLFWISMVGNIEGSNIGITEKLSPGDKEWQLEEQKKLFQCIDKNFTKVKLTESLLMTPIKSTSGIFGFGENIGITKSEHLCSECKLKSCSYRMDKKIKLKVDKQVIEVESGTNLLDILRENEIFIDNPCGGKGTCGKCKVKLIKGLKEPTSLDIKHLSKEEIEEGIRLSCNINISETTELVIPVDNEKMNIAVAMEKYEFNVDPMIKKKYLVMKEPSIEDQRDDYKRISDACEIRDLLIGIKDLATVSEKLRKYNFDVTAAVYKNQLIHIEEGDEREKIYGLAIDVGTTTIAAYLLDMSNGKVMDVEPQINMQRIYGADVISRIDFTVENKEGLNTLRQCIIGQVNSIIETLSARNNICKDNIYDVVIAGNTTMNHLLLGLPCKQIAMAPYISVVTKALEIKAEELGIITQGIVSIIPGISAYVGGDIVSGILSSGMLNSERYSLLLDLGTNGEMVLGNKSEIITCSTAAGPAFEGSNIKHGVGGIKGAICKIDLSQDKVYETVGGENPIGVCGSGVLDTVAQFLKHGIIDGKGKMIDKNELGEKHKDRLMDKGKMKEFILAEDKLNHKIITFTQKDVREVQLAKAAISAGIKILLKEKNIQLEDIETMYIGGGFGSYMDAESAITIGMIPKELKGRIRSIGNCSGAGAKMYLMSKKLRDKALEISRKANYIELSRRSDFQEYFIDSMLLE